MPLPHFQSTGLPVYPPLDTLGFIFYAVFFIAATLVTMRRPALGACILIVAVPFGLYEAAFHDVVSLSKVAVVAVLLGLCAYAGAFAPIAQKAPARIFLAGLLVLGAMALSTIVAADKTAAMRQILKMIEYLFDFGVAAAAYRLDPDRPAIAAAFMGTTIAVSILALLQEVVGAPSVLLVNGHTLPRIAGPLEGPNQLAGYFDVAIPVALAFTLRERMALARAALFFAIFADLLTFSRGGLIGAAAGVVAVAFAMRTHLRAALAPVLGGIAAGVAVMLCWGLLVDSLGMVRLWNFQSNYAGGVGTRAELWHAASVLWRRHPILGVGAGNFEIDIPRTGLHGVRTHANSLYLQALAEGGIVQMAATLWLVYVSIASFVRQAGQFPFAAAALGASVALALHQIFDFLTFYPKVGSEWWIVMALGALEVAALVRVRDPACG